MKNVEMNRRRFIGAVAATTASVAASGVTQMFGISRDMAIPGGYQADNEGLQSLSKFEKVVMPSKNFNILGRIKITDPKDGREKIVMSTFSAAKCGVLLIIDPENLTGETYETPGDFGAWALCQYEDSLLIGTCPHAALLYNFDLKTRQYKGEPAKAPGVTYIYTLGRASDGFVYFGTYAECRLMKYDPALHTITDLGRVDPDENNLYSRVVHSTVTGKLFIHCGQKAKRIFVYNLETKSFSQFYNDGFQVSYLTNEIVCLYDDNKDCVLLDPHTGNMLYDKSFKMEDAEALAKDIPLFEKLVAQKGEPKDPRLGDLPNGFQFDNGDIVGIQGQELFKLRKTALEPEYHKFPMPPPATNAFGVNVDEDGKIWGTSSFGMTAFCYDPKTGELYNTLDISKTGGESYGVVGYKGKIYFTAYGGGEHIEYDPKKPWNMRANINPKMVKTIAPDYIRPHTRSVTNGDGVIWTGWMAKYGFYGSAITRWDVNSGEITLFPDLIGENAIEALTIYKESIIFVTAKIGNGLPTDRNAPKYICKMSFDGIITQKKELDASPGSLCVNGEGGVINMGGALCLLNPETLEIKNLGVNLSGALMRKYNDNIIAVGKENCYIIDQNNGNIIQKTDGVGANIHDVCVNGNEVWAVCTDGWLYRGH